METATSPSRFWRWLLPMAVAGCLYVNYLYNAHPPAGALSNGQMSARHPTLLTPAGYAFSIWGVIFSGLILYTIWQLLPGQRGSALVAALTPPLVLAVLATTGWTLAFSYGQIGWSLVIMLLLLGLLALGYARARPLVLAGAAPGWPTWFLSLYLGWIMLATVLNLVFGLRDALGWHWRASASEVGSYVLLIGAAGLGVALAWRGRDALLPLPLAWGLVGTFVAQEHFQGQSQAVASGHGRAFPLQTVHQGLALTALGAAVALLVGAGLARVLGGRRAASALG